MASGSSVATLALFEEIRVIHEYEQQERSSSDCHDLKSVSPVDEKAMARRPLSTRNKFRLLAVLPADAVSCVLEFLCFRDLCHLSLASRSLRLLATQPEHWRRLYVKDFHTAQHKPSSSIEVYALRQHPQQAYIYRYMERTRKVEFAKKDASAKELQRKVDRRRRVVEECLDVVHLRLLTPCVGVGLLATLVLIAMRMDGMITCPAWAVLVPLWLIAFIVLFAFLSVAYVYSQRHNTSSVFYNMYQHMRGGAWLVIDTALSKSRPRRAICASVLFVVFGVLQLTGLTVKLGLPETSEASEMYKWYLVLLPAWGTLLLCLVGPLFGMYEDMGIYVVSTIFAWVPLGVVSILLCLRLDFSTHATLPLYKIMIPLWAVDFLALVFPAVLFIFALVRPGGYRPEHVTHSSVALFATWLIFGPFVVFQVLLCMYEYQTAEGAKSQDVPGPPLSAMRVFTPLFLWFSVLAMLSVVFSCCYRSEFQRRRRAHQQHTRQFV